MKNPHVFKLFNSVVKAISITTLSRNRFYNSKTKVLETTPKTEFSLIWSGLLSYHLFLNNHHHQSSSYNTNMIKVSIFSIYYSIGITKRVFKYLPNKLYTCIHEKWIMILLGHAVKKQLNSWMHKSYTKL